MRFAIIGHPSRARMAYDLTKTLAGVLFMDTAGEGAYANHRRALEWAARQDERVTIVEDDAMPVANVHALAHAWAARYPADLVSFYLGTGHPRQWMQQVDAQWNHESDHVTLPQLIHGVAYSIPEGYVAPVLDVMRDGPADYAVGDAWRAVTGRPVIYPKRSLFDHTDGPSIATQRSRQPRKARALA